jgi:2-dehydropantoate 2-reductase
MKIVIYGTGGVGGYFGAKLALAGEDVVFIARGEHLQTIQQNGLHLETDQGEILLSKVQATDDPKKVEVADLIIIGVKAWQVTDVAHNIKNMVGSNTLVLPLQNGVEAAKELSSVLGEKHVLGGLCKSLSWVVKPGYIRSIGQIHSVVFGELGNSSSKRTEQLKEVFERAKIKAIIPPDINVALWEKFLFVVSFGGVGAITRSTVGVIRKLAGTRLMLEQSMKEILAVAQNRGIALSDGIVEKSLAFIDSLEPDATTSLQRDIINGKPSELESWNGAVVRLGQQSSVATPLNTFIYNALLPLELQAREKLSS